MFHRILNTPLCEILNVFSCYLFEANCDMVVWCTSQDSFVWQLISRSSDPELFCKIGALKDFSKFTGIRLRHSLFKKEALAQAFFCKFWEITSGCSGFRGNPKFLKAIHFPFQLLFDSIFVASSMFWKRPENVKCYSNQIQQNGSRKFFNGNWICLCKL